MSLWTMGGNQSSHTESPQLASRLKPRIVCLTLHLNLITKETVFLCEANKAFDVNEL